MTEALDKRTFSSKLNISTSKLDRDIGFPQRLESLSTALATGSCPKAWAPCLHDGVRALHESSQGPWR